MKQVPLDVTVFVAAYETCWKFTTLLFTDPLLGFEAFPKRSVPHLAVAGREFFFEILKYCFVVSFEEEKWPS